MLGIAWGSFFLAGKVTFRLSQPHKTHLCNTPTQSKKSQKAESCLCEGLYFTYENEPCRRNVCKSA